MLWLKFKKVCEFSIFVPKRGRGGERPLGKRRGRVEKGF